MRNSKLAHCQINSRKLQKDLISFLNFHAISDFVSLLQKLGLDLSLPLILCGSKDNLLVRDEKDRYCFLKLVRNTIVCKKSTDEYDISYFIDATDFSIDKIEVMFANDSTIFIDTYSKIISIEGSTSDIFLDIIFDENIPSDKITSIQMVNLCISNIKDCLFAPCFTVPKISEDLKKIVGNNAYIIKKPPIK